MSMDRFEGAYAGRTVLLTGHTGFKGSWLAIWLAKLGAHVIGFSDQVPTSPSNFELCGLKDKLTNIVGDVRDYSALRKAFSEYNPSLVFHLAAQPLVLKSYEHPKETFDVNAGGTVNVLEAARGCPSVKAVIVVTTDKCYENREWQWGYRENDPLGGRDPYSASKSMSELAASSYRDSFFMKMGIGLATARAGNVIGGGDFAENRILPDCMRSLMKKEPIVVRNPASVRPWLCVLDPLSGYLHLGAKLLADPQAFSEAWNFGPLERSPVSVRDMVEKAIELWGDGDWVEGSVPGQKKEMNLLMLNWEKASGRLGWRPAYTWEEAIAETVDWFKEYEQLSAKKGAKGMLDVCERHIDLYTEKSQELLLPWTMKKEESEACCSVQPL